MFHIEQRGQYQIIFLNNITYYIGHGPCYKAAVYPVALLSYCYCFEYGHIMSGHVENKSADWKTLVIMSNY